MKKLLQTVVVALALYGVMTANGENIKYEVQAPKGNSRELVPFEYKSFNFHFHVKYPAQWYASEEIGDVHNLYLTKEPVDSLEARFTTGAMLSYQLKYFLERRSGNSDPGKAGKVIFAVRAWDKVKVSVADGIKAQPGVTMISDAETTVGGQPAYELEYGIGSSKCIAYYVKAGAHLLTIIFEAPAKDYIQYKDIFEKMIGSFSFDKDFDLKSEPEMLESKAEGIGADRRK